jgi:hypothetical protein
VGLSCDETVAPRRQSGHHRRVSSAVVCGGMAPAGVPRTLRGTPADNLNRWAAGIEAQELIFLGALPPVISILRDLAFSAMGMRRVSTPAS